MLQPEKQVPLGVREAEALVEWLRETVAKIPALEDAALDFARRVEPVLVVDKPERSSPREYWDREACESLRREVAAGHDARLNA